MKITITRIKWALRQSIAHWKKVVSGDHTQITSDHCPLCKIFGSSSCCCDNTICPLAKKIVEENNLYTANHDSVCDLAGPWKKLYIHWKVVHASGGEMAPIRIHSDKCPDCKCLAEAMLAYLMDLEGEYAKGKWRR